MQKKQSKGRQPLVVAATAAGVAKTKKAITC
jgi:hypothetical protein